MTLEKLLKNQKGAKTFDLSSKNDNVKKIHLCNQYRGQNKDLKSNRLFKARLRLPGKF